MTDSFVSGLFRRCLANISLGTIGAQDKMVIAENVFDDEPYVPPPKKQKPVVPFHQVHPNTVLEKSKGTFVVTDVSKFEALGFTNCSMDIHPTTEGYFVILVQNMPAITKQQLMDAQKNQIIIQCDVDYIDEHN